MAQFALWERVLVDSALSFAQVIQIDERRSGTYYIVQFPDSGTLWRHESELTPAPQPRSVDKFPIEGGQSIA